MLLPVHMNGTRAFPFTTQTMLFSRCSIVYQLPPPVLTWHPPENNGPPPLTLGAEVQLCWLLPLTLEPSA